MNDRHLVALLLRRAESALARIEETYGRRLYAIAMNILADPRDAEETVNDTYLALWNTIPPAQPNPLSAYAYRIVKNIAMTRLRRETAQRRDSRYLVSLDELAECVGRETLEDALRTKELGRAINAFLGTVSKENRILFLRRYWFGDSISQIAQNFGYSENTVSVRLSRTRSKLKAYLLEEGLYESL